MIYMVLNRILLPVCLFFCFSTQAQYKNFTLSETFAQGREEIHPHLSGVTIYDLAYHSFDNTAVKGFLIMPKDATKKYPVIIFNRGGNGSYGMVTQPFIIKFLSKLASKGYIVIGSQLRGSEGSEGVDEFGGRDVDDVLFLFKIIDELKAADKNKIAQIGWSRGGVTNFQVLKKTDRINSTVTIASFADLMESHRKIMFTVYRNRIPGYALDSVAATRRVSPIYQIDSIRNKKTSLLFMHGDNDTTVLYENSVKLHAKAQLAGINSKLTTYSGGDHGLMIYFNQLLTDIDAWLEENWIKS
jgi:dipeptidyl aminopeptidase/acylaminoacyl peptidase